MGTADHARGAGSICYYTVLLPYFERPLSQLWALLLVLGVDVSRTLQEHTTTIPLVLRTVRMIWSMRLAKNARFSPLLKSPLLSLFFVFPTKLITLGGAADHFFALVNQISQYSRKTAELRSVYK
jgi:hypothetical protein